MSVKAAFGTEKRTIVSLGALSVLLTLALTALPLLVGPVFA